MIRIVDRWNPDRVIYECEADTLREAVLKAVRAGISLRDADLSAADLRDADLSAADLRDANLRDADLSDAKTDLFAVLDTSPKEVAGLLAALREGRVDGSVYHGDCACLVGTLANVRGCDIDGIEGLVPDSSRPAERWFLAIMPGHTPANHPISKLTEEWVVEWMRAHEQPIPRTLAEVLGSVRSHPGESLVAIAERLVAAAGGAS